MNAQPGQPHAIGFRVEPGWLVAELGGWIDSVEPLVALFRASAEKLQETRSRKLLVLDHSRGVVPPDFILANTIGQQKDLLAISPADARFVTSLARKTHQAGVTGDWAERARTIAEREVYPALTRQLAALSALTPRAGNDEGVWRLPTG